MKKRVILFTVVCLSCIYLYAQKISNIDFKQLGNNIIVSYSLTGLKSSQVANISLYVSTDGGQTFTGPLKEVDGDVGENVKAGEQRLIQWEALKEIPDFGGNIVFDVRASIMDKKQVRVKKEKKEKPPKEKKEKAEEEKEKKPLPEASELGLFAGVNSSNYAPIGLTAGFTKGKFGGYISGRINTDLFNKVGYETDGKTIINFNSADYWTIDKNDQIKRLTITGGCIFMPHKNIGIYLGGGLSKYELLWQIREYDYPDEYKKNTYVSHNGESFIGIEAETGMLLQYKRFILGAGASSPNFKWIEGVITLGYKLF